MNERKIYYHLPGLFEFYELYKNFLRLYREHREYFYEFCEIGSIYGAPADCLWGGGRVGFGDDNPYIVRELMREYDISARLTFSNSLLTREDFSDYRCNELCRIFSDSPGPEGQKTENGIIIYSKDLLDYISRKYPAFYYVSSTTKVITDFNDFTDELHDSSYRFVVPDFRLNKSLDKFNKLTNSEKDKVEFLVNECCDWNCRDRKECYDNVSRKSLGLDCTDHICKSKNASRGYRFSEAMKNPGFISVKDIVNIYQPMGFSHFKIEGRSLGSAMVLEFLLYYMVKPECQLLVREELYLDSSLDLW